MCTSEGMALVSVTVRVRVRIWLGSVLKSAKDTRADTRAKSQGWRARSSKPSYLTCTTHDMVFVLHSFTAKERMGR